MAELVLLIVLILNQHPLALAVIAYSIAAIGAALAAGVVVVIAVWIVNIVVDAWRQREKDKE